MNTTEDKTLYGLIQFHGKQLAELAKVAEDLQGRIDKETAEAYQRGLNDAKNEKASCQFCMFNNRGENDIPCKDCSGRHINCFRPMEDDRVEVGDEVTVASISRDVFAVVGKAEFESDDGDPTICYSLLSANTGTVYEHVVTTYSTDGWDMPVKTGRHFDHIDKLLEAMKS